MPAHASINNSGSKLVFMPQQTFLPEIIQTLVAYWKLGHIIFTLNSSKLLLPGSKLQKKYNRQIHVCVCVGFLVFVILSTS